MGSLKCTLAWEYETPCTSETDAFLIQGMHPFRGFNTFRDGGMENHLVVDVVRQDLTRELGKVTGPLTEETSYVLQLLFTDDTGKKQCGPLLLSCCRKKGQTLTCPK